MSYVHKYDSAFLYDVSSEKLAERLFEEAKAGNSSHKGEWRERRFVNVDIHTEISAEKYANIDRILSCTEDSDYYELTYNGVIVLCGDKLFGYLYDKEEFTEEEILSEINIFTKGQIKMADEKKKGIITEFKEFIARGNVIDMAVGIIMGGAFTPIVNSLVNDIVMPGIGLAVGKMNFSDLKIILQQGVAADEAAGIAEVAEVAINYGNFIQVIINFLIVSFCVFMLVKGINKLRRKKEEPPKKPEPPKPSNEEVLLTEIRDLLKEKK